MYPTSTSYAQTTKWSISRMVNCRAIAPRIRGFSNQRTRMRALRFTEQQIVAASRQEESGTPVVEMCRKLGASEQTFECWKRTFAGMGAAELRRLRQVEDENRRLKQLVADLTLDKQMIQEAARTSRQSRPSRRSTSRSRRSPSGTVLPRSWAKTVNAPLAPTTRTLSVCVRSCWWRSCRSRGPRSSRWLRKR